LIAAAGAAHAATARSLGADALPARALADAPSLYLRDASASPIRWQPWSGAAFALARKLNRPVLIDIGAAWCHWCHVMDQTTYADPAVVELVNRDFVPIKVDTDERPGVDRYYQSAAEAFSSGGWPLTVFATPDGAPLLITGYLPPRKSADDNPALGMADVLQRVSQAYRRDPKAAQFAHDIARKLASRANVAPDSGATAQGLEQRIVVSLARAYDRDAGGFFSEGARFYDFPAVRLALAHGFRRHPEFTAMALASLRKMADGGVFDQLGGGFHRYSTDSRWRVPHFEKMAYDQAMAIHTYAQAFAASHDPRFAEVAKSSIGYVNGTLLDPSTHTFYAHQDADAFAGDDGSYYTWTVAAVKRVLTPQEARAAILFFGVADSPGLAPDGSVVLRRAMTPEQLARELKAMPARANAILSGVRAKLLAAREKRRRPAIDHAILTDRNALMASAYLTAASALEDASLQKIALDDLDFILGHMRAPDGGFYHVWSRGHAGVAGVVADQVYMANALLDAFQSSGDARYLAQARGLARLIEKEYRDPKSGLLQDRDVALSGTVLQAAANGAQVLYDNPTPSVQASAAIAMMKLAAITSDDRYLKLAAELMAPAISLANDSAGASLGTLGLALDQQIHGETIVAIVGDKNERELASLLDAALATYRPGKVVVRIDGPRARAGDLPAPAAAMYSAAAKDAGPLAFVCAGTACANPARSAAQLVHTLESFGVEKERAKANAARTSP
jgi:uncharacterized protein